MVFEAETHKRSESVIEVVNDCFGKLCKAETRDGVFGALEYIDDAMCVYYRCIEYIDKKLSSNSNESKLENNIKRL